MNSPQDEEALVEHISLNGSDLIIFVAHTPWYEGLWNWIRRRPNSYLGIAGRRAEKHETSVEIRVWPDYVEIGHGKYGKKRCNVTGLLE